MNGIILYQSKYGSAKKYADWLSILLFRLPSLLRSCPEGDRKYGYTGQHGPCRSTFPILRQLSHLMILRPGVFVLLPHLRKEA